jgi:putative salt-induced outer membrane protein
MKKRSFFAVLMSAIALVSISAAQAEDGWKNESQAGVVVTTGNTDTSTLSAAEAASYQFDANILKLTASFLSQKSAGVESGKNWSLGLRYERVFNEKLTGFLAETVDGNQFSGINQQYATDIGAKYTILKNDQSAWFVEGGYRYLKQNLILLTRNLNYGRVYSEFVETFSPTVSAKYWIEYLPNFTTSDDWQLNTELSLSAAISSIFSVKSAYLLKYDNQVNSPGLVKTDKTFTTSLVAKF